MSVYISGLEMPQDGRITLQIDSTGGVYVVNKFSIASEKYEKSMTATEIQPHGRLIDADELKERIRKALGIKSLDNLLPSEKTIVKQIDMVSPIQPESHWIPVTERLPERDELVLVTYKTTDKIQIRLCMYFDDGSENPWWSYIDACCLWNNTILAWMPLPEPYKGVTE